MRLEPLEERHAAELLERCGGPENWRYMPLPSPRNLGEMRGWIAEARERAAAGAEVPFAIIHDASGRAVGSTRYLDIRPEHRALEIGWTWIAPEHQRTAVNTECKFLLLAHAFDSLSAVRVQLKTDARNDRSQRAIERIGALREGVLRRHMVLWDGFIRDTVIYSIIDLGWPEVRRRLVEMLEGGSAV